MTDRTRGDSSRRASGTGEAGPDKDDIVHDHRSESPFLEAIGAFAREEEAEIGTYAANTSHTLSDVARELAVQKILALQARERAAGLTSDTGAPARARLGDFREPGASPGPRRRHFALALGGGFVAAALALALWMRPGAQDPGLPAYSIAARGGMKEARGTTPPDADDARTIAEPQRLSVDSQLIVAVRPETAVVGSVGARAFVVQGADATEVAANAAVAPTGAIELRFHGADLIGSHHGSATLRIIVGRPDVLGTYQPDPGAPASPPADARWRALTVPLDLVQP